MREIQFLSHQYKIASKIEIYILPPNTDHFKKIGYLSLDNNERSHFQARELKTVYTDYLTTQVKFNLLRCHTNIHNVQAQVGLIAISILGEYPNKTSDYQNNEAAELNFNKLEDEMIYDPATVKRLKDLYKAKYRAVELEDYDEAKKIKKAINSLKSVSQSLIQLEERKRIAIKNDDFDSAKLIKYEIERLRNAVAGANLNEMNQQILREQQMKMPSQQQPQLQQPSMMKQTSGQPGQNPNTNARLFPGKQPYEHLPIDKEFEMDNDDDIYRIRNNINTNYQIHQQQQQDIANLNESNYVEPQQPPMNNDNMTQIVKKKPASSNKKTISTTNKKQQIIPMTKGGVIDVDKIQVGNDKNFEDLLNEQLNNPDNYGNMPGGMVDPNDPSNKYQLTGADYKIGEPLIPIIGLDLITLLFNPQWKIKEQGIIQLSKEIKDYPNSKLFQNHSKEDVVCACFGVCAYLLNGNISQSLLSTMEIVKLLLDKFTSFKMEYQNKVDFDKYLNDLINLLVEHIGSTNYKLKERSETTLLELANHQQIGSKILFDHIITGPIKKTLSNSSKHLVGRYTFLTRLIGNFGYNRDEVPLNAIMGYAIKGYTNPQNQVREASLELIKVLYRFEGSNIYAYYQGLRKAQKNTIDEALAELDGLDEPVGQGNAGGNNINKQQNYVYEDNDNKEMVNKSSMLDQEQQYNYQNEQYPMDNIQQKGLSGSVDEFQHACRFCGLFDINLTEEQILIHQYKECPMLIPCFKCGQIQQISELHKHFLEECSYKKQFVKCDRCKEPVLIKDKDKHDKEMQCNQYKSENVANRCPLCHQDITPPGEQGWNIHLLQQTCPRNPRSQGF